MTWLLWGRSLASTLLLHPDADSLAVRRMELNVVPSYQELLVVPADSVSQRYLGMVASVAPDASKTSSMFPLRANAA